MNPLQLYKKNKKINPRELVKHVWLINHPIVLIKLSEKVWSELMGTLQLYDNQGISKACPVITEFYSMRRGKKDSQQLNIHNEKWYIGASI